MLSKFSSVELYDFAFVREVRESKSLNQFTGVWGERAMAVDGW